MAKAARGAPHTPSEQGDRLTWLFLAAWTIAIGVRFGRPIGWRAALSRLSEPAQALSLASCLHAAVQYAIAGVALVAVISALVLIGDSVLATCRWRPARSARLPLAAALGLCVLSTLLAFLGLVGLFSPLWLRLALGALLFVAVLTRLRRGEGPSEPEPSPQIGPAARDWIDRLGTGAAALIFLVALGGALSPETFYDSLMYHLAVPAQYLLEGRFVAIPRLFCSGFPYGWDILYGLAIAIHSDALAKLLPAAACLILLGVFRAAAGKESWVPFLLFGAMPGNLHAVTVCGTDLGASLFACLSWLCLMTYWRGGADLRYGLLASVFAGMAVASKYTAFLVWLPTLAAVLVAERWLLGRGWREALARCACFAAVSLVLFAPWALKNWLLNGNPVYPFLEAPELLEKTRDSGAFEPATWLKAQTWLRLLSPWRSPGSAIPERDYFGMLSLWLIPWLICSVPRDPRFRLFLGFFAASWVGWGLVTGIERYLMPVVAAELLLAAYCLGLGALPAGTARLFKAGALVLGAMHAFFAASTLPKYGGWQVLFGLRSREQFLMEGHAGWIQPYYAIIPHLEKLPKEARVLFIGESRSYYSPRRASVSSYAEGQAIAAWANEAGGGEALYARMRSEGISHLFLNGPEALRMAVEYQAFPLTENGRKALAEFWPAHAAPEALVTEPVTGLEWGLQLYRVVDAVPRKPGELPYHPILDIVRQASVYRPPQPAQ